MSAPLPSTPCHLNGKTLPLNQAQISVMDRGFVFGDGVYEVLSVYGGRIFRFDEHMARLQRSLDEVRITNPHDTAAWHALATELIVHPDTPDALSHLIYIQITRGVAMREHAMISGLTPTVFIMIQPMVEPSARQRTEGVHCVSADDFRWKKAHIKSTSLLGAVMARQISVDAGAVETVMFRDGLLSEASASNIWVVKNNQVLGPVKDNLVLEGIRYGVLEQLCADLSLGYQLRPISRSEVFAADELLITSATKEILPITRLDDQAVGNGSPGPIYHALYAGYQGLKNQAP
jgi:D-alanine transaminase